MATRGVVRFVISQVDGDTVTPHYFELYPDSIVRIGRDPKSHLAVNERGISGVHAELGLLPASECSDGKPCLCVRDLSMNGTGVVLPSASETDQPRACVKEFDEPVPDGAVLHLPLSLNRRMVPLHLKVAYLQPDETLTSKGIDAKVGKPAIPRSSLQKASTAVKAAGAEEAVQNGSQPKGGSMPSSKAPLDADPPAISAAAAKAGSQGESPATAADGDAAAAEGESSGEKEESSDSSTKRRKRRDKDKKGKKKKREKKKDRKRSARRAARSSSSGSGTRKRKRAQSSDQSSGDESDKPKDSKDGPKALPPGHRPGAYPMMGWPPGMGWPGLGWSAWGMPTGFPPHMKGRPGEGWHMGLGSAAGAPGVEASWRRKDMKDKPRS
mmetsp:Transcript_44473/g.105391  ORF Transcript_44473/g.105391 Transcript_44473/m.105391 type:complete len:383 (+) Transcript_44473:71-1219(+)